LWRLLGDGLLRRLGLPYRLIGLRRRRLLRLGVIGLGLLLGIGLRRLGNVRRLRLWCIGLLGRLLRIRLLLRGNGLLRRLGLPYRLVGLRRRRGRR